MRQTLRLGRVAGIPVGLHWSVLVITLLLAQTLAMVLLPDSSPGRGPLVYWSVAAGAAVLFLASLLAHELSHALVARHYRLAVKRVTLWLLGGVAELDGDPPHPRADLFVALAGPLASAVSGAVFGAAAFATRSVHADRVLTGALSWLAEVNLLLAAFNLLPGAPLDGGRVLRAALWWRRGDRTAAARTAAQGGVVLGLVLLLAGAGQVLVTGNLGGLWLSLVGWFLMSAANAERADGGVRRALRDVPVLAVASREPVCGYGHQTVDVFVDSVARHHRHRTYPVVDLDGQVLGLVNLGRLAQLPASRRGELRLREAASRVPTLERNATVADAAAGLARTDARLLAVVDGGRLIGVVGRGDVARAYELAALGSTAEPARDL